MEKLICPACGSSHLDKSNYHEHITENLGDQVLIEKVLYRCTDCGSEGDFFNENEVSIENALTDLKSKLIVSILDGFTGNKVSLSSIERALELPQRTLTKWKNGASSPTSAGITLLKFIKLFPWLLEVAENKFDYEISQKIFIGNAFQKMINKMTFFESEFTDMLEGKNPHGRNPN
ncbi:MAG: hypothetical protein WCR46_24025 [Deltaproteobacteria bacterium]